MFLSERFVLDHHWIRRLAAVFCATKRIIIWSPLRNIDVPEFMHGQVGIIERFGKYEKLAQPGFNCVCYCLGQSKAGAPRRLVYCMPAALADLGPRCYVQGHRALQGWGAPLPWSPGLQLLSGHVLADFITNPGGAAHLAQYKGTGASKPQQGPKAGAASQGSCPCGCGSSTCSWTPRPRTTCS